MSNTVLTHSSCCSLATPVINYSDGCSSTCLHHAARLRRREPSDGGWAARSWGRSGAVSCAAVVGSRAGVCQCRMGLSACTAGAPHAPSLRPSPSTCLPFVIPPPITHLHESQCLALRAVAPDGRSARPAARHYPRFLRGAGDCSGGGRGGDGPGRPVFG